MCTDILPILDAASARRDYRFLQELIEAVSSFAANIAEGPSARHEAPSSPISCGLRRGRTVRSGPLYLAADRDDIAPARADALIEATNVTGRMIQGLSNSLFRVDDESPPDEEPPPE